MPIFSRTAKGGGFHGGHAPWHTQDAKDIDCAATGCKWNLGKKCMVPSQCKIKADGGCAGFEPKALPAKKDGD